MVKKPLKTTKNEIAESLLAFKSVFITVGIFSAILNILMLTPSLYMLQVYDRVLTSRNESTLLMLTVMVVGAYLVLGGLEFVRSFVLIRVSAKLDMMLNKRVYTAAFEQSLKRAGVNAGQFLQDLTSIRQFMSGNALFAFFDAPWFPIYLFIIFLFDTSLGFFALFGSLTLIALAIANERVSKKPLSEANEASIAANNLATNNLRNAEVIEAMGMLPNLMSRWYKLQCRFLLLQGDASEKSGVISAISRFVRLSLQSLILGLGGLLVLEDKITPGMMIVASILMGRALTPVEQLMSVWKTWSGAKSAYGRINELLTANPAREVNMPLPKPKGLVTVEAITVIPAGGTVPTLRNVSFSIAPGDVLGIIGPSGAGKSTLARALVGIASTAAGHVRLDSADIFQWNKHELGPYIGYLPQNIELFAGTVSENIARFGEVNPSKVISAAQQAGVHDMILRLPEGYDTRLGDDGAGLSGGQKQRLGLARAIYDDPSLLVLDEPNSNLDETGEQALINTIKRLQQRGKTIVMITHRSNALAATSKLLLLVDGTAQLFGPTKEVMATLANKQKNKSTPAKATSAA
ncbi:ABC-type protease/lipase transport system, ATPase and permease component [Methylophaga aminisulfidivorans MP]|uniref:ABC-type protease/lipase transport system, ATPase and permease component n=1 Tax=Methylophaga aminisulfidivorans MP TaxID=1026882 RepID=F5T0I8_9GAMM|nr:type I secretion system permease/ATPase [Methylophaga aminisulfidivorans]EGL55344.1 ABC-type protease/lipase transport system, ATPase and permease component [Methylophaga aminisulfidivorans MP]